MTTFRDLTRQWNAGLDRFLTRGVKWLILINVAVFIVTGLFASLGIDLFDLFAQNPIVSKRGTQTGIRWDINWLCAMQFFTYMFLHADFWHLFMNMLVLWFFGPPMEQRWGTVAFLKFYLTTGFLAGALHGVLAPIIIGLNVQMIGASGAVLAVLLAFGLYYPKQTVLLWFVLPIPAGVLVVLIGIITILSLFRSPGSQVSHLTHLAGFAFGYLWIWLGQRYPEYWLFNSDPGPFSRFDRGRGRFRGRF